MGIEAEDSSEVGRTIQAPVEAVWAVLSDGWLYSTWVVGASRIRDVDDDWPREGSQIHHSAGMWPLLIDDTSEVLRARPLEELVLKARGWPLGEAHVFLTLETISPEASIVRMREDAVAGPGRLLPKPARQALILPRNRESLARLAYLAEGRHRVSITPA
ncbi:MAG TPA: SRPBCC family protein [Intrasporangium sp.]|uniref:SRPBCC family protein n=1 Tax=Intrasporangium sp. TaxID=1925024 RepID=UPI002D7753A0|nr:SRPBCC family protein [Intrasporangium sp.]HET7398036.1 SRPBCC family protein [Intrasporangium sp.]